MSALTNPVTPVPALVAAPVPYQRNIRLVAQSKPLPPEAFDKILNHLVKMDPKRLGAVGAELFEDDVYGQLVFASWLTTIRNRQNPRANPQSTPINFVGEGGAGKSATVYKAGQTISEWLTRLANDSPGQGGLGLNVGVVPFRVIVKTLAGCNDISELLGVVVVQDGRTVVCPHDEIPVSGECIFGVVFIDDFTRGDDRAMSGFMEFVNALHYNGVPLGEGLSVIGASNPPGLGYKAKTMDKAQRTRFLNIPMITGKRSYINDLVYQGLDTQWVGLASGVYEEVMGQARSSDQLMPTELVVNKRNLTIVLHMAPILFGMPDALALAAGSTLGTGVDLGRLLERLRKAPPLEAEEVLGLPTDTQAEAVKKANAAVVWMEKNRVTDFELRLLTCVRINQYVTENIVGLPLAQMNALATFLYGLLTGANPDPELFRTITRSITKKSFGTDAVSESQTRLSQFISKWQPAGYEGPPNPMLHAFKKESPLAALDLASFDLSELEG